MAVWAVVVSAAPPVPADPFGSCHEQFARAPRDYESAYCFYEVTFKGRIWEQGAEVFEALIARHPDNALLVVAYGHIFRTRDPDRAEALYRQSAAAFRDQGDAMGEIIARSNLRNFLFPKGRVAEAAREAERVVELGAVATDPLVKAHAWIVEAAQVQDTGTDLGVAYRLLKRAEEALGTNGGYRLTRTLLLTLGPLVYRMGRLDEALALFERLDEVAAAKGETVVRAIARYNVFNTWSLKETLLPTPGARSRLMRLAQQSLAMGIEGQNLDITLKSHRALAELLAAEESSRPTALEHVTQCLDLAVNMRQPHDEAVCSWVYASLVRRTNRREAIAAETRALDAAARAHNPWTQAYSAGRHMRLSWGLKPRDAAIDDALAALDAIETVRSLQTSTEELFATWTSDYYWLSGRVLQEAPGERLDLAFSTTERMRARSLLDALDRSRAPLDAAHPAVKAHREILEEIAAVQRDLMDPSLPAARRRDRLDALGALELREQEARRGVEAAHPLRAAVDRTYATIAGLQAALADDEAVLSYQVGLWETYEGEFGGGSWLVAVTNATQSVVRLPDRAALEPIVPVFAGLLEGGTNSERRAAVRLYDVLAREAIDTLPAHIRRLIVIPDSTLHHLPFDALRASADAPPLGARYEIVVAPSVTLWLQWRTSPPRTTAGRMLTLADPAFVTSSETTATSRGATLLQGLRLGRLPHAREEARAIARHVSAVDALVGANASENALKSRDLREYDILHIAAHAIADEAHPERSAVLLAPGDPREDGLLQAREIAALDLDGRVVVLSACQTAAGAVLSGEGVLSLARAFFQAGAHAVVGSRWPLRDEDAAALFETFYRRLGAGASLAQALKATQDEARAAGRPPSAWAALVLLGNGDLRPMPDGRARQDSSAWPALTLVAGLTLLVAAGYVIARRRTGSAVPPVL